MKIAYISSYPPRECGIGTFTQNLVDAMVPDRIDGSGPNECFVVALSDPGQQYQYPPEVRMVIHQEQQADYIEAANFINLRAADLCILEHEFGIFGGETGVYILPLLHHLNAPLIVTLHTVVKQPSDSQKAVLKEICRMAVKVVVMTQRAVQFLVEIYDVPRGKIELIAHGVPDIRFDQAKSKKELKLEDRKVLLTFGFIGRNKGIETVIKALPRVIEKHPGVLYMVLGKTHPHVIRRYGEEYRSFLYQLVKRLKLTDHVLFLNDFIHQNELFKYLAACDIYITPYLNEAQITSGTLSYAMGAGCAVVSTPYWHAAELLGDAPGELFDFKDSNGLAVILDGLLSQPALLKEIQKKAAEYGKQTTWPLIGAKYLALADIVIAQPGDEILRKETIIDPLLLPPFTLSHIKRLTDDTGIIQHAKYGIPNLKEGYCLDDNARALLMVLMAYRRKKDPLALELSPIYLSFIHYLQNRDGSFRNFLSFNRSFLDSIGSEDSFGRTVWALGYLLGNPPNDAYYQTGLLLFFDASQQFELLRTTRGMANTIIGVSYYLKSRPTDESMTERLRNLAYKLIGFYENNSSSDWLWFEESLTYDNGILPLALLHAAEILKDTRITEVAMETLNFLTRVTLPNGHLSLIGNESWYQRGGQRSTFAQQPLDAEAMVLMYQKAFHLTKDKEYLNKLYTAFMWFLGENDQHVTLYDFETGGCYDGFEEFGVNRNQGAESTIAYLVSHLTVLQAYEEFYQFELVDDLVTLEHVE